ncbi:MAG: hypothetical protein UX13_C0052G0001 [Candidatus Woesebacteria bacterium GW2011_GWB1_45_5]|uniref:Lecithin:cholesterol acyltransferase n=1 Tax=Candidatus Woesebacteria bacterium GW2011_GWB1_45_5 TaxID=1618581 RepID=A0A0G1MLB4_9BACT|nr:MAG: hypothetical protein UX13_C0052G0001 [Candidatus Woesebacteria bacterium GW2011_GWB1_45_5]
MQRIFKYSNLFIFTSCFLLLLIFPKRVQAQVVLFQDDFNDGDVHDWVVIRNGCSPSTWALRNIGSPEVPNFQYGIVINGRCITETIPSSLSIPVDISYSFEVDLAVTDNVSDRNFVFKYKDPNNWYDVHIYGQMIHIQKVIDGIDRSSTLLNSGTTYSFQAGQTYHFKVEVLADEINLHINNFLIISADDPGPYLPNFSAGLQASGGGDPSSEVWFDNVLVSSINPAEPSLPPFPTPSLTPSPIPTSIPVDKVVFIPGFGGSWNTKALLSCAFDSDPNHWSLAPYAEDIYTPLLNTLTDSGWSILPFYYDWRQLPSQNASVLAEKIESETSANERVNIVGHSMGGLIASDYLISDRGQKINSLLAIGSPLRGAVQAYPAWSGGDIWKDNFLGKIATTLYLKRCGGKIFSNNRVLIHEKIPSIQNLLPVLTGQIPILFLL